MDLSEKIDGNIPTHPWELSRTNMLLNELNNLKIHGKILDIGCGDGYFDDCLLERFPNVESVWGIDIFADNSFHEDRKHMVCSYEELGNKKFDYILMMDVIEHIEDDVDFLKSIEKYMANGCILFITVPAFQSLFSLHDEELNHFRRYNFKQLKSVLNKAGYKVNKWSYFYLSLIFLRLLTMNKSQNLSMWKCPETSFKTVFVKSCLNTDYKILKFFSKLGIHIPGLSLLVIVEKE